MVNNDDVNDKLARIALSNIVILPETKPSKFISRAKWAIGLFAIGTLMSVSLGYIWIKSDRDRENLIRPNRYYYDLENHPAIRNPTAIESPEVIENEYLDTKINNSDLGVYTSKVALPTIAKPLITDKLIEYIIHIENGFTDSPRGARGLMQIMPDTWKEETRRLYGLELSFDKAHDPKINKEVGTNYLKFIEKFLSDEINGWNNMTIEHKQDLIAAAYNGGIGRLVINGGDISKMPFETICYVNWFKQLREKNL